MILLLLAWAQVYVSLGWSVLPILFRGKRPWHHGRELSRWTELRLTADELPRYFRGEPQNIGVLLGEPSAGLVDIDLDCAEARALAPFFLPDTATFGRLTAPISHWEFHAPGAATEQFRDLDGATMVELRSTGRQTVFPGSTHEDTGEAIEWSALAPGAERRVLRIDAAELRDRVVRLAVAALLMRHGWTLADAVGRAQEPDLANGVGELGAHVRGWLGVADAALPAVSRPRGVGARRDGRFTEAAARWLGDHPRAYPRGGSGVCPACRHAACFGQSPGRAGWSCFSAAHGATGVGRQGRYHWFGDALDLEAAERGCRLVDVLQQDGYLVRRAP